MLKDMFSPLEGEKAPPLEGGKTPPLEGGITPPPEGGETPPLEGGKLSSLGTRAAHDVYGSEIKREILMEKNNIRFFSRNL